MWSELLKEFVYGVPFKITMAVGIICFLWHVVPVCFRSGNKQTSETPFKLPFTAFLDAVLSFLVMSAVFVFAVSSYWKFELADTKTVTFIAGSLYLSIGLQVAIRRIRRRLWVGIRPGLCVVDALVPLSAACGLTIATYGIAAWLQTSTKTTFSLTVVDRFDLTIMVIIVLMYISTVINYITVRRRASDPARARIRELCINLLCCTVFSAVLAVLMYFWHFYASALLTHGIP